MGNNTRKNLRKKTVKRYVKKRLGNKLKKRGRKARTYKKKDFKSGDGMLTGVWGPALWHYLHIVSFNYPIKPTIDNRKNYRDMILNLQHVLPCKYCRDNFKNNLKMLPLKCVDLKNRDTFSRWVYKLHELVNAMLGKSSGLSYCDVRERYEHFRSRCTVERSPISIQKLKKHIRKTKKNKENGCTEPLYGKKSQCIVKIVPLNKKVKTFQIDRKCIKRRI